MTQTQVRVVGSGFTTFRYNDKPIAFLDTIRDAGQRPMGQPYEAITPIGAIRPVELVAQRVLSEGTLQLTIRELWNAPVWWQLSGLEGTHDIGSVFDRLAQQRSRVTCQLLIKPPGTTQGGWRGKVYQNCLVTAVDDSETVDVGALSVPKNITVAYTHSLPLGGR